MYIKTYLVAVVTFFLIDMVWLGLVAKSFYSNQIGQLLRPDVNWVAAIIFYLLFVGALVYFVIVPGVNNGDLIELLFSAALFGLVTYATYDLTNLATLKDWPLLVTVVDLIWGMALSTLVSLITYLIIS
jgi:uncharacterized membrane protein